MENYVIVKGSNDLLDREGKVLFVGLRKINLVLKV